tara:strand:- start:484 stop:1419 length:936 start_codon:yes stop_codon:yes gene_type:complete
MNWKDIKNQIKAELNESNNIKESKKILNEGIICGGAGECGESQSCAYNCTPSGANNQCVGSTPMTTGTSGHQCVTGFVGGGPGGNDTHVKMTKNIDGTINTIHPPTIKNKFNKPTARIREATVSAGDTKFNLRTGVNKNPTKLGIKIQFEPKGGMLALDVKAKLEVALQEKLNTALAQYDIQISKDTDVPRAEVIGFFIPLSQLKNLIVKSLTGKKVEAPKVPAPAPAPTPIPPVTPPTPPQKDDVEEMISEQLLREALRVKDLNEMSKTVVKEDFYGFINAGQNILRTLDEKGITSGKKYLEYLVKHNII